MSDTPTIKSTPEAAPGASIGPYKLLELIAEGGFGEVWLAERREPMVQRVALKIIKAGMDTRAVVARFEQERQALAVMDHPNIAKVFDAGATPRGRPYFVMEHVAGEPITAYCDRHNLTVQQRLELFIPVCEAVQHAHHKGIIHRDIKPSNILVSVREGQPIPKVIDFGVAKATSRTLTEKTIFTETGQLIGTPEYMSPEQAEMGATDIDTRTDVYSLGVVLYELLAGLLPFDPETLRSGGYDAIRKIIREQEPARPSTKLSTIDDATAAAIANHRQAARDVLAKELRRELDWIPLKALRKDRTQRYQTPADVARDIERYIKGEPLEAGPESATYRIRKLIKRNRAPFLASALILFVLVSGIITTAWGFVTASRRAEGERQAKNEAVAAQRSALASKADADEQRRVASREAYAANIQAAEASMRAGDVGAARFHLQSCPTEARGWEWSYLDSALDNSTLFIQDMNCSFISADFSPDGARIIVREATVKSGSSDEDQEQLAAWDIRTRTRLPVEPSDPAPPSSQGGTIGGHPELLVASPTSPSESVTLKDPESPGGINQIDIDAVHRRALIVSAIEGNALLVDLEGTNSPKRISTMGGVMSGCFCRGGGSIITSDQNGTTMVWSSDGQPLIRIGGAASRVVPSMSDDGRRALTTDADGMLSIFDAKSGERLAGLFRPAPDSPVHTRLNADGSEAAVWSNESGLVLFDGNSAAQTAVMDAKYASYETEFQFVPGYQRLAVVQNEIGVWDNGARSWLWRHPLKCRSLAVSDDGTTMNTISGSTVLTVGTRLGTIISQVSCERPPLRCFGSGDQVICCFAPGSTNVAVVVNNGLPQGWIACEGQAATITASDEWKFSFVTDRTGTRGRLVDWRDSRVLHEWEVDATSPAGIVTTSSEADEMGRAGELNIVVSDGMLPLAAFSEHAPLFACIHSGRRRLDVVDLRTGTMQHTIDVGPSGATCAALSPRGDFVVTAHEDGTLRLWKTDSGVCVRSLPPLRAQVAQVVVSDVNTQIVALLKEGSLWALPGERRSMPIELTGQSGLGANSVIRIAADGSSVLAMPADTDSSGQVRVWSLNDPGDIRRVDPDSGRDGVVYFAAISADGRWIAYQLPDLSIKVYDVQTDKIVRTLSGYSAGDAEGSSFSPDSTRLLVAAEDRGLIIRLDGTEPDVTRFWEAPVQSAAWCAEGKSISTVVRTGSRVEVYSASSLEKTAELVLRLFDTNQYGWPRLLAPPAGNILACNDGHNWTLYDIERGVRVDDAQALDLRGSWLAFLPSGDQLATVDGLLRIQGGARLYSLLQPPWRDGSWYSQLSLSPDGSRLFRSWGKKPNDPDDVIIPEEADILDTPTGHVLARIETDKKLDAWSADNTRVVEARQGGLTIWDPLTGEDLLTLFHTNTQRLPVIAWPPGGLRLLSFDYEHVLRIYDASPRKRFDVVRNN